MLFSVLIVSNVFFHGTGRATSITVDHPLAAELPSHLINSKTNSEVHEFNADDAFNALEYPVIDITVILTPTAELEDATKAAASGFGPVRDPVSLYVIDFFAVSIQPLDCKVEETLIWDLVDLNNNLGLSKYFKATRPQLLIDARTVFARIPPSNTKLAIEKFVVSDLALDFTFLTDKDMRRKHQDLVVGPLAVVLNTIGSFFLHTVRVRHGIVRVKLKMYIAEKTFVAS